MALAAEPPKATIGADEVTQTWEERSRERKHELQALREKEKATLGAVQRRDAKERLAYLMKQTDVFAHFIKPDEAAGGGGGGGGFGLLSCRGTYAAAGLRFASRSSSTFDASRATRASNAARVASALRGMFVGSAAKAASASSALASAASTCCSFSAKVDASTASADADRTSTSAGGVCFFCAGGAAALGSVSAEDGSGESASANSASVKPTWNICLKPAVRSPRASSPPFICKACFGRADCDGRAWPRGAAGSRNASHAASASRAATTRTMAVLLLPMISAQLEGSRQVRNCNGGGAA